MQRITGLAACRDLGGLAARSAGLCAGRSGCTQPALRRQRTCVSARPARPLTVEPGRRAGRRRLVFAGETRRLLSSQPGAGEPPGGSGRRPAITVVGVPDPLTLIRCKGTMYLIRLFFELDVHSEEFDRGVKQALVHVSDKMSRGRYHELVGLVSHQMIEYVEKRCRSLTKAQRRQLAVQMDDILLVLPEDVTVVFDTYGRKFCTIVMRFWLLSPHEGAEDPEGTKIFKVAPSEDGSPQKKIATAVYEFHRELTTGASPDWLVTTVWHWHWNLAE